MFRAEGGCINSQQRNDHGHYGNNHIDRRVSPTVRRRWRVLLEPPRSVTSVLRRRIQIQCATPASGEHTAAGVVSLGRFRGRLLRLRTDRPTWAAPVLWRRRSTTRLARASRPPLVGSGMAMLRHGQDPVQANVAHPGQGRRTRVRATLMALCTPPRRAARPATAVRHRTGCDGTR